jgi:TetR/AcrR family transcriptional regulator
MQRNGLILQRPWATERIKMVEVSDISKDVAGNIAEAAVKPKRSAVRSKQAILKAATVEFCSYGYTGARVERISRRSKANMRMLYHYFGSKEGLYMAVLEAVYGEIRSEEQNLDLKNTDPITGMRRLILFTFDFFAHRTHFIALINNENLLKGRFLRRSHKIKAMTAPLAESIEDLLQRGCRANVFREGIDAVQLYVTIVAQSQIHISNRYTLSILFDQNLGDEVWLAHRREHVQNVIMSYITAR